MVLTLIEPAAISKARKHIIWIDNLFTGCRLLVQCADLGFSAAGTVQTSKTAREEAEQQRGTLPQKKNAEHNRGLIKRLSNIKLVHANQIPWGELHTNLSSDGNILQLA